MKTDFYTKTILTIIAICLTINVLRDFQIIQPAHASQPLPVVNQTMDVNIKSIGGNTFYGGTLPVEINKAVDVNIKRWDAGKLDVNMNRWNAGRIDVNIDRWNAGTLDVKNK